MNKKFFRFFQDFGLLSIGEGGGEGAGGDTGGDATGGGESSTALATTEGAEVHDAEFVDDASSQTGDRSQSTALVPIQNGKLSAPVQKALQTLKATDPALAKMLSQQLFFAHKARKSLAGGLGKTQEALTRIRSVGNSQDIETALTNIEESVSQVADIDALYYAADPRFLEGLTGDAEGKEAFVHLFPAAFGKFRQLNPDGHASLVAQSVLSDMEVGTFQGNDGKQYPFRLPLMLELVSRDVMGLPDGDAKNSISRFVSLLGLYLDRLTGFSQKAVAPERKTTQTDPAKLGEQETALVRREWLSRARDDMGAMKLDALQDALGSRRLTSEQRADFDNRFKLQMGIVNKNTAGFNDTIDRYFGAKDQNGYLRFLKSHHEKNVPRVVKAIVGKMFGGQTATTQTAKPGEKRPAAAVPSGVPSGAVLVAKEPGAREINFAAGKMGRHGAYKSAWLKDGRQVYWKD